MRDFVLYRSLVLGTAILLAGLGCSGCVALTKPGANSSCSWSHPASSDDTSGAASNTVVLIDTSASYWPTKGSSASLPDSPSGAVQELLHDFGNAGRAAGIPRHLQRLVYHDHLAARGHGPAYPHGDGRDDPEGKAGGR